jgi:hypothetical protein
LAVFICLPNSHPPRLVAVLHCIEDWMEWSPPPFSWVNKSTTNGGVKSLFSFSFVPPPFLHPLPSGDVPRQGSKSLTPLLAIVAKREVKVWENCVVHF